MRRGLAYRCVALGIMLVLLLLPGCIRPDDDLEGISSAGTVAFNRFAGPRDSGCAATGSNYYEEGVLQSLILKTNVWLRANGSERERWTARVNVTWNDWPTEEPLVGEPSGSSPGDKDIVKRWDSRFRPGEEVRDELLAAWSDEDFKLQGTYRATVIVELHHEKWDGTGWRTSCRQSHDDPVEIGWAG